MAPRTTGNAFGHTEVHCGILFYISTEVASDLCPVAMFIILVTRWKIAIKLVHISVICFLCYTTYQLSWVCCTVHPVTDSGQAGLPTSVHTFSVVISLTPTVYLEYFLTSGPQHLHMRTIRCIASVDEMFYVFVTKICCMFCTVMTVPTRSKSLLSLTS